MTSWLPILVHGDAAMSTRFPSLLGEVTAESVARAAAALTPNRRAVLEVVPAASATLASRKSEESQ